MLKLLLIVELPRLHPFRPVAALLLHLHEEDHQLLPMLLVILQQAVNRPFSPWLLPFLQEAAAQEVVVPP